MILLKLLWLPCFGFSLLNPPQYISLMPSEAGEVLERENQIDTHCPKETTKDIKACKEEKLKPQKWQLTVFQEPKMESKKLGLIVITATPGKGVIAEFVDSNKKSVPFESDSKGTDWGYSSYFEFTVKDIKGDWIQLPRRPFPQPIWINIKAEWPIKGPHGYLPTPSPMNSESVYSAGALGDIVITQYSGTKITFRKENENDMPCGEEAKTIPAEMLKETTKPIESLYDSEGHLIAWLKNPRGC